MKLIKIDKFYELFLGIEEEHSILMWVIKGLNSSDTMDLDIFPGHHEKKKHWHS